MASKSRSAGASVTVALFQAFEERKAYQSHRHKQAGGVGDSIPPAGTHTLNISVTFEAMVGGPKHRPPCSQLSAGIDTLQMESDRYRRITVRSR